MNVVGSILSQDVANRLSSNITNTDIAKSVTAIRTSPGLTVPDEVLSQLLNKIAELLSLLKSGQGATQNTSLNAGIRDNDAPGVRGSTLTLPSLPSLSAGNNINGASPANAAGGENNTLPSFSIGGNSSTGRALNVAPLPSLVNPATGSLSTTELPKAFNPPAIPSLTGGSAALPTVNASDSALSSFTGISDSASGNISTDRALNVAPLPSLVNPATGSLSTTELPKAFNPPAIPSLTGGSSELPSVNASDSLPILLSTAPTASTAASINSSQPSTSVDDTKNIFAIPSLLGSNDIQGIRPPSTFGIPIPSLTGNMTLSALSSTQGFSLTGASGIVDGLSSDASDDDKTRTNHFK
ncbi:MAG: hypothetical protein V3U84_09060 [Thiotrichaceae bacterium]